MMNILNEIEAIDNKLNNVTCPKMIDSLIYERKATAVNWKAKTEEARQKELRNMNKHEPLVQRIRRLLK